MGSTLGIFSSTGAFLLLAQAASHNKQKNVKALILQNNV
jgi:hypothetical protein